MGKSKGRPKDKKGSDKKVVAQKKKKREDIWTKYKVSGDKLERTNKFCPKCGAGIMLANHKNRRTCGKCGYVEFI